MLRYNGWGAVGLFLIAEGSAPYLTDALPMGATTLSNITLLPLLDSFLGPQTHVILKQQCCIGFHNLLALQVCPQELMSHLIRQACCLRGTKWRKCILSCQLG